MPENELLDLRANFSISWLDYHARYDSDMLAAVDVDTGRRFTYQQFNSRLCRLAEGLNSRFDLEKGDRVAVVTQNSTDVFEMLFACWELGAALMPLNWRLSPREIAAILEDGAPRLVIYDAEFEGLLENSGLPRLKRSRNADEDEYEPLIASCDGMLQPVRLTIDDLSTLLYTSGTTGKPKGVIGTFRMMRDTIIHAALHGELSGSSKTLTCAPLFHSAGLYGFSMPTFHYGGALYVMSQWDPQKYLDLMTDPDEGITHTIGVPVQYRMLADLPAFEHAAFPSLRVAGVGAAPVTTDLLETWASKGVNLAQSYGLTEAFSVAFLPPHRAQSRPGSAGHRMLHTHLKIADDSGERLAAGAPGEIMIKGPAVTPGYWNQPEETDKAFIDGWFRTGDIGRVEKDGTIYIVGRLKDMYISGGENVYPAEVENVLSEMDDVGAAAVVAVADDKWGQVGLAVIQAQPGSQLAEDAVTDWCREHLAGYKVPRYVRFVDALPLNAQGKVQKDQLLKEFGNV
ncbi:MAG: AMP-binding protein [Woeseiaceae bacterium]|nr:AMP-binding protein [Woeseiaceae bacterium]